MKAGDLVKMKYDPRRMHAGLGLRDYADQLGLVLETAYNAVKLVCSDGSVRTALAENYEVINENR
jgi:ribosomal protein L21E